MLKADNALYGCFEIDDQMRIIVTKLYACIMQNILRCFPRIEEIFLRQ
uniref:Uncharacterized protein n=1 Tax=uncultured delta proteobacterium HF0200_19J16 TaxID=710831 RepID=E0XUB5_9DELT|nr:hypothetical protein [uncultured delta proteobacterium HF0200_19J16]